MIVELDPGITVAGEWDNLEVETSTDDAQLVAQISERLACTPGIAKFLEVDKHPLGDLDYILDLALQYYRGKLQG